LRLLDLANLVRVLVVDRFGLPGSYLAEIRPHYAPTSPAWSAFGEDLARLARIGTETGVCAAVLIHTHLARLDDTHPFEPYYQQVAAAAAGVGLFPIHSLSLFRGLDPPSLSIAAFDPHPNQRGHRLLAEALVQGLMTLPAHCWHPRSPSGRERAALPGWP
jgi:hypothetical protein